MRQWIARFIERLLGRPEFGGPVSDAWVQEYRRRGGRGGNAALPSWSWPIAAPAADAPRVVMSIRSRKIA